MIAIIVSGLRSAFDGKFPAEAYFLGAGFEFLDRTSALASDFGVLPVLFGNFYHQAGKFGGGGELIARPSLTPKSTVLRLTGQQKLNEVMH